MLTVAGTACLIFLALIVLGVLAYPGLGWFLFLVFGMVISFVIGDR